MIVLLGEFGGTKSLCYPYLERHGWGRIWASNHPQWSYDSEPWGFDNGAYTSWVKGKSFSDDVFIKRIAEAESRQPYPPIVAVIPDVVGKGLATLALAEQWLSSGRLNDWPWYLAVQDGTCLERTRRLLHHCAGLFLDGTDDFKKTASVWCEMAHRFGKKFHYGRCSTEDRMHDAVNIGADSMDSAIPVIKLNHGKIKWFKRFESIVTTGTADRNQNHLPWDDQCPECGSTDIHGPTSSYYGRCCVVCGHELSSGACT